MRFELKFVSNVSNIWNGNIMRYFPIITKWIASRINSGTKVHIGLDPWIGRPLYIGCMFLSWRC